MSNSKEVALKVDHVEKYFKLPTEHSSEIKQVFINWTRGIKGYKKQKVLKDISFTVNKGDFFGIVGRNGSGKSTLLKVISGIYPPNNGKVEINGTLIPFIELGVGFNPELTGRENVYLNGAMLGFSEKQIDAMYDDIVDFADRAIDGDIQRLVAALGEVLVQFDTLIISGTDKGNPAVRRDLLVDKVCGSVQEGRISVVGGNIFLFNGSRIFDQNTEAVTVNVRDDHFANLAIHGGPGLVGHHGIVAVAPVDAEGEAFVLRQFHALGAGADLDGLSVAVGFRIHVVVVQRYGFDAADFDFVHAVKIVVVVRGRVRQRCLGKSLVDLLSIFGCVINGLFCHGGFLLILF